VLQSKSSNGKCAKPHTVAASNDRDHLTRSLLLLLVHVTYICVLLFAHIPFVVNRTFNTTSTERLQQRPLLFAVNRTYRTFFLWMLHLAPLSHPSQSTTLLRLESPGGKYAKLHTVAASNNRDPTSYSFCFYSFATHIYIWQRWSRSGLLVGYPAG